MSLPTRILVAAHRTAATPKLLKRVRALLAVTTFCRPRQPPQRHHTAHISSDPTTDSHRLSPVMNHCHTRNQRQGPSVEIRRLRTIT